MNTFLFNNQSYQYFDHNYNATITNERAVEVPIIWRKLEACKSKDILEIGNVLSHYSPINHEVIDKYENSTGVTNIDVVDFRPTKKYDLIVSISTLEHVGWDEDIKDSKKIIKAISTIKKWLKIGGEIIVTLPIGYNTDMDKLIDQQQLKFFKMSCLKRISEDNKWIEATWHDIKDCKYDSPYRYANGLVIAQIKNSFLANISLFRSNALSFFSSN